MVNIENTLFFLSQKPATTAVTVAKTLLVSSVFSALQKASTSSTGIYISVLFG